MAWSKPIHRIAHNALIYAVLGFVLLYSLVLVVRVVRGSHLFDKQDRINIVFYGEEAKLLSFGITDNVNYIVSFSHEDKVMVPGGYERYVVGSLGKLADLEDNPDIMKQVFSSMTSAYVDFYVYPNESDVYEKPHTDSPKYSRIEFVKRLFSQNQKTNANIIDKLYLAFLISKKRQQDFVVLRSVSNDDKDGNPIYSEKNFQKKYKGFFFHQNLREESEEVQIKYNTYKSALTLSRIIEGQGIRVVDLSYTDESISERCIIVYGIEKKKSRTVKFLQRHFNCKAQVLEVEGADIMLVTGSELEKEWE